MHKKIYTRRLEKLRFYRRLKKHIIKNGYIMLTLLHTNISQVTYS